MAKRQAAHSKSGDCERLLRLERSLHSEAFATLAAAYDRLSADLARARDSERALREELSQLRAEYAALSSR